MIPSVETGCVIPSTETGCVVPIVETGCVVPIVETSCLDPSVETSCVIPSVETGCVIPSAKTGCVVPRTGCVIGEMGGSFLWLLDMLVICLVGRSEQVLDCRLGLSSVFRSSRLFLPCYKKLPKRKHLVSF